MISCNLHDYVEIVCLFGYPIKLTLFDKSIIQGKALDTQINEDKQECLKIDSEGVDVLIELENISKLQVCVDNPYFITVSFK